MGARSPKPVNVILIADTDFAHDGFFHFYRNENNRFSEDDMKLLNELRNVQFLANAVDALVDDEGLLELRARRPKQRPLETLQKTMIDTQAILREVEQEAKEEAEQNIEKLREDFKERLDKIEKQSDLDENAKKQLKAQVQNSAQRKLDKDIEAINLAKATKIRNAKISQKRTIEEVNDLVRWLALGLPALVLALIALGVLINRKIGERQIVPSSRQRRKSS